MALLGGNGRSIWQSGNHLGIPSGAHQLGGTNKDGGKRPFVPITKHRYIQPRLKRIYLPPKGIPRHGNVHHCPAAADRGPPNRCQSLWPGKSCRHRCPKPAWPRQNRAAAPSGQSGEPACQWWCSPRQGIIKPSRSSSCSGRRTSTASTPSDCSMLICSLNAPCSAKTPIFMMLLKPFVISKPGLTVLERSWLQLTFGGSSPGRTIS